MNVKMQQRVEREIVMATVDALLAAGFNISVDNGASEAGTEYACYETTNRKEIESVLYQTDEDTLYAKSRQGMSGYVIFIYGNEGPDVMSDYSTNLEQFIGAPWTHPQIIAAEYNS